MTKNKTIMIINNLKGTIGKVFPFPKEGTPNGFTYTLKNPQADGSDWKSLINSKYNNLMIKRWVEVQEFNEGDFVEFDSAKVTQSPDGKYTDILPSTIKSVPMTRVPTETTQEPVVDKKAEEKEMWDGKDRRIVRQNALTQANYFLRTCGRDPRTVNIEELFEVAEKCEDWVYRGFGQIENEIEDLLNPFEGEYDNTNSADSQVR